MNAHYGYLYMMTERQNRIISNQEKIELLQKSKNNPFFQETKKKLQTIKKQIQRIERQIQKNKSDYLLWKNPEYISEYGLQIQAYTDAIALQESKRVLLGLMKNISFKYGKISGFTHLILFHQFYQHQKITLQEELQETTSMKRQIFPFLRRYLSIREEYKNQFSSKKMGYANICLMEEQCQNKKKRLLSQKDSLEENYRNHFLFLRGYEALQQSLLEEKEQLMIQKSKQENQFSILFAQNRKKQAEINHLESLNQAYVDQIEKLREVYLESNSNNSYKTYQKMNKAS